MPLLEEFAAMREGVQRIAAMCDALPVDEIMLARKLKHVGAAISARLEAVLQPHGLAEADFIALMQLFGNPGRNASPGELCGLTAQRPTNMTRIADALVRKGLATRTPDARDRRRVVLRMTARGERLARTLLPQLAAEVRDIFSALGRTQRRRFDALLLKLATTIDSREEQTP